MFPSVRGGEVGPGTGFWGTETWLKSLQLKKQAEDLSARSCVEPRAVVWANVWKDSSRILKSKPVIIRTQKRSSAAYKAEKATFRRQSSTFTAVKTEREAGSTSGLLRYLTICALQLFWSTNGSTRGEDNYAKYLRGAAPNWTNIVCLFHVITLIIFRLALVQAPPLVNCKCFQYAVVFIKGRETRGPENLLWSCTLLDTCGHIMCTVSLLLCRNGIFSILLRVERRSSLSFVINLPMRFQETTTTTATQCQRRVLLFSSLKVAHAEQMSESPRYKHTHTYQQQLKFSRVSFREEKWI